MPGEASGGLRVLMLASDAHGSVGGISQYNIDVLAALSSLAGVRSVEIWPRLIRDATGALPEKIRYDLRGVGGIGRYVAAMSRRIVAGAGYDLVLCAHVNLLPVAWAAARRRRVPLLLMVYGIDVWQPTRSRLANALLPRADMIGSISAVTLRRLLSWCPVDEARTAILPNAIDLSRYGMGPRADDLVARYGLAGRRTIMTFGRLVGRERAKGFDEVLAVLPRLLESHPDLVYLIAGTGPDADRLAAEARRLGLAQSVRFTGFVPEERKADHYRLADVYAMPSRGEGFGFVILEAMACGVPSIASTADGGLEAVLGGMLGRTVDPDDPVALEAAIRAALDDAKHVPEGIDHFAHDAFARRLDEVLDRLRTSRKPRNLPTAPVAL